VVKIEHIQNNTLLLLLRLLPP